MSGLRRHYNKTLHTSVQGFVELSRVNNFAFRGQKSLHRAPVVVAVLAVVGGW